MSENRDWTGNKKTTFVTLGASNHSEKDRDENDYYATAPSSVVKLLEVETFNKNIWENACRTTDILVRFWKVIITMLHQPT